MKTIITALVLSLFGITSAHALAGGRQGFVQPTEQALKAAYKTTLQHATGTNVKISQARNSQYFKVTHLKPGSYLKID